MAFDIKQEIGSQAIPKQGSGEGEKGRLQSDRSSILKRSDVDVRWRDKHIFWSISVALEGPIISQTHIWSEDDADKHEINRLWRKKVTFRSYCQTIDRKRIHSIGQDHENSEKLVKIEWNLKKKTLKRVLRGILFCYSSWFRLSKHASLHPKHLRQS